jgi:hypothetical protein
MDVTTRRGFVGQSLAALTTTALLETLFEQDLFADSIKPVMDRWAADVAQLAQDVRDAKLRQTEWQKKIEELFRNVDLPEMLKYIDFEKLTAKLALPDNGARNLSIKFPASGEPGKKLYAKQIFAMKKGRAVVPHGHNNMATAFLVLKGDFHGRHYDRLRDEPSHLILRPTIDRSFSPGDTSSISDEKDNVHWFTSKSEPGVLFNIHVSNLRKDFVEPTGRVYVDPNGEKLAGGLVRAPLIEYSQAHKLYG